jgi:hypothetical protein
MVEREWIVLGRKVNPDGTKGTWEVVTLEGKPNEYAAQDCIASLSNEFEHHQFTKVQVPK